MLRLVKKKIHGNSKRAINEELCIGLPKLSPWIAEQRLHSSEHCWRSRNKVILKVILWESTPKKYLLKDLHTSSEIS